MEASINNALFQEPCLNWVFLITSWLPVQSCQRAASEGSAEAELWIGDPVPTDPALERYWLELAAGHGSHEAEDQLSLQQVDRELQIHWFTK